MAKPEININKSSENNSWGIQSIKNIGSNIYALGGRTAKLIGLKDLQTGIGELYQGEYKAGCKSMAVGTLRLGVSAVAVWGAYKVAITAKDYMQKEIPSDIPPTQDPIKTPEEPVCDALVCDESEDPSLVPTPKQPSCPLYPPVCEATNELALSPEYPKPDIGKCNKGIKKILTKWKYIPYEKYNNDPKLKEFIHSYPEGKDFTGLNYKGELLFRVPGGYDKWDNLREKIQKPVLTENGIAPLGTPYATRTNPNNIPEGYYVDTINWGTDVGGFPHMSYRLRNVTKDSVDIHSYAWYPKVRGGLATMGVSSIIPTEGKVYSPEPLEHQIRAGSTVKMTTLPPISEKQYRYAIKKMVDTQGNYDIMNGLWGINCSRFVLNLIQELGEQCESYFNTYPAWLGKHLEMDYPNSTITDPELIKL